MNLFWDTIALYNSATWIFQIIITILGAIAVLFLRLKGGERAERWMKIYLIASHLWISIVYYAIYCTERRYSILLSIYWAILAITWAIDLIKGTTKFTHRKRFRHLGLLFIILPLVYPLISLLRGLEFPYITTPIMPCTVALFTIGIFFLFAERANIFVVLLLLNWAMLGISKMWYFSMFEDFILVLASIPSFYIFFREYFTLGRHHKSKPDVKYINALILFVCITITAALLASVIFQTDLFYSK